MWLDVEDGYKAQVSVVEDPHLQVSKRNMLLNALVKYVIPTYRIP